MTALTKDPFAGLTCEGLTMWQYDQARMERLYSVREKHWTTEKLNYYRTVARTVADHYLAFDGIRD